MVQVEEGVDPYYASQNVSDASSTEQGLHKFSMPVPMVTHVDLSHRRTSSSSSSSSHSSGTRRFSKQPSPGGGRRAAAANLAQITVPHQDSVTGVTNMNRYHLPPVAKSGEFGDISLKSDRQ